MNHMKAIKIFNLLAMSILLDGCCILMPEFCSDEVESEAKKEYNMIQNWYFSFVTPIRGVYFEFDCNQNINNATDNDSLDYQNGSIKGYDNGYSSEDYSYKGQYYTTDKITYRCDSFFNKNNKFIEIRRIAIIKCATYSTSEVKYKISGINITYSTIIRLQKDYFVLDNSKDRFRNNEDQEINCETNAMSLIESRSLKFSIAIPSFINELVNAEVKRLSTQYLTIGNIKYKNIIVNFESSDLSDKNKKIWASNYDLNDIKDTGFVQISTFLLRAVILKNIDKHGSKILNKSNRSFTPIKLIVNNEELITYPNKIFAENDPGLEPYLALINEDDFVIDRNSAIINSAFKEIVAGIKIDLEFIILHELSHLFFALGNTISDEQACDCIAYSISNSKDIGVFKYLFQDAIIKNKGYFIGKDTASLDQLENRIYKIQKGEYSNIKSTNECLKRKY